MLYYVLATVYVLVCLLLLLVILLQQGRGGDIASAFGGSGSQTAFGARQGATVLSKATTVLGALFMIGALVLGIIGQKGPSSILSGTKGPARTPAPAAPANPTAKPSPAPANGTTPPAAAPAGTTEPNAAQPTTPPVEQSKPTPPAPPPQGSPSTQKPTTPPKP
jgi:preprotein translocase subunit SecG